MPLPFSLPQRPSLPSITAWTTSPKPDDADATTPTPQSAPPRTSASITKRLSSRSIRHTSLVVSRPTTPAKASPLSATFGLPVEEDDDPFGVRALEQAGLMIKEAGTKENHRPGSDAFQYRPSPNSPIWRSSMASAMSKNSRPSLDGRASVMTGRPSLAHSRQSSISEIGTQTELDGLDSGSLRAMSPVRETSQSSRTSPETTRKPSPKRRSKFGAPSERPPPLKLQQSTGDRRKNEDASPKSRLSAVQEKVKEIEKEQKAREAKAKETKGTDNDVNESDLDRLAREIREMAQEHEEEDRRSEVGRRSEEASRKSAESRQTNEAAQIDDTTEEILETDADAFKDAQEQTGNKVPRDSKRKSKRSSTIVPEIKTPNLGTSEANMTNRQKDIEDDEQGEDDDDDDEDYDSFDDEEEPVIIEEVVHAAAPINFRPRNLGVQSLQARAQVVSIHMPPPPAIPSRNPRRARNSEIPDGGDFTPMSPEFAEDTTTRLPRDSVTPEPTIAESKPASLHSIPDNDSSSSYSLGNERDSFAEANNDIMSQTSHGSVDTTPTKAKMTDADFVSIDQHLKDDAGPEPVLSVGPDHATTSHSTPSSGKASPAISCNEDKGAQPAQDAEQKEVLEAPAIPERRRPFSFEVAADDEALNTPSIESALKQNEQQITTEKKETTRKEAVAAEGSSVQPIVIPTLPEDDESEYEEDFS